MGRSVFLSFILLFKGQVSAYSATKFRGSGLVDIASDQPRVTRPREGFVPGRLCAPPLTGSQGRTPQATVVSGRVFASLVAAFLVLLSGTPVHAASHFATIPSTRSGSPSGLRSAELPLYCMSSCTCPDGTPSCTSDEGSATASCMCDDPVADSSSAAPAGQAWWLIAGIGVYAGGIYGLRQFFDREACRCERCGEVVKDFLIGRWEVKPGTSAKARRYRCQNCGHNGEFVRTLRKLDRILLPEQQPLEVRIGQVGDIPKTGNKPMVDAQTKQEEQSCEARNSPVDGIENTKGAKQSLDTKSAADGDGRANEA